MLYEVITSMDLDNFVNPADGMMTPYTAVVIFSLGVLVSNFLFNTILMKKPLSGEPTNYKAYFKGKLPIHLVGVITSYSIHYTKLYEKLKKLMILIKKKQRMSYNFV